MKISTQVLICLGCLMFGTLPGVAWGQEVEGNRVLEADAKAPLVQDTVAAEEGVLPDQVLSANPFLLLWEWANVEYEQRVSPTGSLGLAGSTVSFDDGDVTYTSLNGFYRHYPSGALTGFYIGGRLGVHRGTNRDSEGHVYGFGVDIGYTWLLGEKRNFFIGLGIGATRFFGGDLDADRVVLPTIRLMNVGFAF